MDKPVPVIDLPFKGNWMAIKSPGHHRYAYDFVCVYGEPPRLAKKWVWREMTSRTSVEDHYSWGQPVLAPFNGTVVHVSDGWDDRVYLNYLLDIFRLVFHRPKLSKQDLRLFAGNYVLLQGDSTVAFFAHLRCGSIGVSNGQHVKAGETIGNVGCSGYTMAPHLHFQLMDGQDLIDSDIIPFRVREFERREQMTWVSYCHEEVSKGDRIRSIEC